MKNTMSLWVVMSVISFALSACSINDNSKSETVYISSGAIQCESNGKSTDQTAALLMERDVAVKKSQCGKLTGIMMMTMCGSTTTNINLHEIAANDMKTAEIIGFANVTTLMQGTEVGYEVTECKGK